METAKLENNTSKEIEMKKGFVTIFLVAFLSFHNGSLILAYLSANNMGIDTLEVRADSYIAEVEMIFKETEPNPAEREKRLFEFATKAKKALFSTFSKSLTKATLESMHITCSAMPNLESAGFSTFPQTFILLEILGKDNIDSVQMINALENGQYDWKFRVLICEILGSSLRESGAKEAMISIMRNKNENPAIRSKCIVELPLIDSMNGQDHIGEYILKVFEEEDKLKNPCAISLGYLKYGPAIQRLIASSAIDTTFDNQLAIIRALGNYGQNDTIVTFMLSNLKKPNLRGYIAEQLGNFSRKEVIDSLIHLYKNDSNSFVRFCAGTGLALSENDDAYKILTENEEVLHLGEAARRGKVKALFALVEINTPKASEKLRWLATKGSGSNTRIRELARSLLKGGKIE